MFPVSVYLDKKTDSIVVKRTMTTKAEKRKQHNAATVLLTNAHIGANIRGRLVEEHDRKIQPHKSITEWPRLRYLCSQGYVDSQTGTKVDYAKAVYMVGNKAYYLPE